MLAYYTQQSLMSNPGRYADVFDDLPTTVADLVRVVQGVTIHLFWAEHCGLKLILHSANCPQLELRPLGSASHVMRHG